MRRAIKVSKKILAFSLAVFMGVAVLGLSLQADAAKKKSSGTYAEGDDIAFGTLDGNIINWTILTYDDTTKVALLVSRKTLHSYSVLAYRDSINQMYLNSNSSAGYVKWEDNYWRGWLNQIFYNQCFTDAERATIQKTSLTEEAAQTSLMNFYHDTTLDAYYLAGNVKNSLNMNIYNNQSTTSDYIFFLSTDEYTEYKDTMKYETSNTWPLRTNAYDDPAQGLFVNDTKKLIERKYYYLGDGIRPAMYVKLGKTDEEKAAESGTDTSSTDTITTSDTTSSSSSSSTSSSTNTASTASTTSSATTTAATTTSTSSTSTAKATSSKKYANNGTNIGNITLPDDASYSMTNGSTAQVAINLDYLNSTDKQYNVTYKSSDASVFTVDSNGLITSVAKGTGTLTVRMKKSNGKTYTMTCRIDVT
ncbi:Ig-like domain-containing protein [Pseudobutyrivibrio sp. LB2011]|uniref:Ig-like domain-containing protein n=1 Tax=Pseudobutyrivibrio sp. LB2011 TaxID=1408312 RepID=UPI0006789E93|nr:DUF6273 domain-containing protein [Pseudobutyrivibrio sp. LB2011]